MLAVFSEHPVDDVSVHLRKYKRSVILDAQISLLDGLDGTWTTAEVT